MSVVLPDVMGIIEASGLMRDTLTVERLTPAPLNPDGLPIGDGGTELLVSQPCSDQDSSLAVRAPAIVNGVAGALPMSICYTAWFDWPDAQGGEILTRVNGRHRPLMKQGPPVDVGGQGKIMKLELGVPTGR